MKALRIVILVIFPLALSAFLVFEIRERRLVDYTAPVISAESDTLEASVNVTDAELLHGMTAQDNLNGDVTSTMVVASRSKFIRKNTRTITYAAFDQNNNVGTYTRELTYTDYVPPRFVLKEPLKFLDNESKSNTLLYRLVGAEDVLDGDITGQIVITTGEEYPVDADTVGQTVNLQVSNRAGDTSVLEIEAAYLSYAEYNRQAPNLEDYIVYTSVGKTPDFRSYIIGVRSGTSTLPLAETDFNLNTDFSIDAGGLDISRPGVYKVYFTLSGVLNEGEARQQLGTAEMIVVVTED